MEEDILLRHYGFFHPKNQKFNSVVVYGAGSVGSHVAYGLSKLGVNNIHIVDFDVVELHNVGNQFYKLDDVGKKKVEALKENLEIFTGNNIAIHDEKIEQDSLLVLNLMLEKTLHILTFDNIEARKNVYETLKDSGNIIMDIRAGGQGWEIYIVRLDNEEDCKIYENTFNNSFSELKCGEMTVIYNMLNVASEACNIFKKMNNEQLYPTLMRREMMSNRILFKEVER